MTDAERMVPDSVVLHIKDLEVQLTVVTDTHRLVLFL
jgi:hypothetical protein